MIRALGLLLGIDHVTAIDRIDVSLAAAWAQDSAFWLFLLVTLLFGASLFFYLRWQRKGPAGPRLALGVFRGLLLVLLVLTLADPVLQFTLVNRQQPTLYVIFDGTDSMAIADELPEKERAAIEKEVGWQKGDQPRAERPSRMEYVQALIRQPDNNLLQRLTKDKQVQIEAFLFDGNTTSQLRKLKLAKINNRGLDPAYLATQLTTKGQVTALGTVVAEVGQQFGSGRLAGVVLFSDFANNSGSSPSGSGAQSPQRGSACRSMPSASARRRQSISPSNCRLTPR